MEFTNVVIAKETNIANGVKISANSLVNKSIEKENTLYGGTPAIYLKDTEPWYYEQPWYDRYRRCEELRIKKRIQ